jgi:hypothetical protein
MPSPQGGVAVNVPLLYADLAIEVRSGPYTSKVLLAVNHGTINVPTLQLVMPTAALLEAARRIVAALSSADTAGRLNPEHGESARIVVSTRNN